MAYLSNCRACGQNVAKRASSCPHCGCNKPGRFQAATNTMEATPLLMGLTLTVVLLLVYAYFTRF